MSNDKKEQASRNPFAEMLEEIHEDNELRKESSNMRAQIEQMEKATAALKEVNESLESKLQHARFIVSSVDRAVGSAQKTLLDNYSLMSELKNLKLPASLDDKAVAQIKEEHGKLISDYKASLGELKKDQKEALAKHREKIEQIKDGESVWLSIKAWVWAIVIVIAFLAFAFGVGIIYAKTKLYGK